MINRDAVFSCAVNIEQDMSGNRLHVQVTAAKWGEDNFRIADDRGIEGGKDLGDYSGLLTTPPKQTLFTAFSWLDRSFQCSDRQYR
jgi:hypothetical protein